jgi:hypothetical protein
VLRLGSAVGRVCAGLAHLAQLEAGQGVPLAVGAGPCWRRCAPGLRCDGRGLEVLGALGLALDDAATACATWPGAHVLLHLDGVLDRASALAVHAVRHVGLGQRLATGAAPPCLAFGSGIGTASLVPHLLAFGAAPSSSANASAVSKMRRSSAFRHSLDLASEALFLAVSFVSYSVSHSSVRAGIACGSVSRAARQPCRLRSITNINNKLHAARLSLRHLLSAGSYL